MRTVHETEALRPSDPIPKSHPNHPLNTHGGHDDDAGYNPYHEYQDPYPHAGSRDPADDELTPEEEAMGGKKLYSYLKRRLQWAEEEQTDLETQLNRLEKRRRENWVKKEMLLERVVEQEIGPEEAKKVSLKWNP